MPAEDLEDARGALARAELAPALAADGSAAVAQVVGLVVAVERQGHGERGAARPVVRRQSTSGPNPVDHMTPPGVRPAPGRQVLVRRRTVHQCPPFTDRISPEMKLAWLEARNTAALAMSCGVPSRRRAIPSTIWRWRSGLEDAHCRDGASLDRK